MYTISSDNKNESLLTIIEIFKKQIKFEKKVKAKMAEKIEEIKNMQTFVVDTGWLFEDIVNDAIISLNSVEPYKQKKCETFNDFAKLAIICLAAYQGPNAESAVNDYLLFIDDLKPVATREDMIKPLERYIKVCDINIMYFERQISCIENVLNTNKNQNKGKE